VAPALYERSLKPPRLLSSISSPSQPTRVYFGQKDIQQAIILRALLTSLLFQSPSSSTPHDSFRLIPTTRDEQTGLALSSRNAYLSPAGLRWAPTLYRALSAARDSFESDTSISASRGERAKAAHKARAKAEEIVARANEEAQAEDPPRVRLQLDYVSFNSAATLVEIGSASASGSSNSGEQLQQRQQQEREAVREAGDGEGVVGGAGAVLSGAMWVIEGERRTRMIDNLLLGSARKLLASSSSSSP
jgi:pantoate--beta-alanine ligase